MKNIILFFTIFFFNCVLSQIQKGFLYPINSKNDYSFLDKILKNKKFVLLGEQTHGEGATFDEKVNLIKYLHENLGFNTIAFEAGFYDNYKAFQLFSSKKEKSNIFNESVFSIWSDAKSFQNLINYIDERATSGDTIKIVGFDNQEGSIFNNNFIDDLKEIIKKHKFKISENTIANIEKVFVSRDFEKYVSNKKDSLELVGDYDLILKSFNKIKEISLFEKMIQQVFISKISDVDYSIKMLQNQKIEIQNPRDGQMAKNLIFLSKLNANEKIICWGASYHFARNLNEYEYTDVTENYFGQQAAIEKNIFGQTDYKMGDGKDILKDALPMGQILKDYFKDEIYSLAFSSYNGEYGKVDDKVLPILEPPINSIEREILNTKNERVFFDFSLENIEGFYCSALGNLPMKAKWNHIFDGLFFIKTSYPPKSRTFEKSVFLNSETEKFEISGKTFDFKTNLQIQNVEITITNTKNTFESNKFGEFKFDILKNNFSDKIIVSSIGYKSDTISIPKLLKVKRNKLNIRLKKENFEGVKLKEVAVTFNEHQLSAKEILEKVAKNIELNYYQKPYNQTFYFKSENIKDEEKKIRNEAIIKTYNSKGMIGSNSPEVNLYGQVEQLKNSNNKLSEYFFTGSNIFSTLFYRDLVLSKSNILYKTSSYDLKNEGKIEFENKTVFKISFVNNSPGSYSTGYGYPAPKVSTGFLYVDSENFAILRYEHCVQREPFELKDGTERNLTMSHKIIETYKFLNNYYFINQLTIIDKKTFSPKVSPNMDNKVFYDINLIKSYDVKIENIETISQPIVKMNLNKGFVENIYFWKNNIFMIENNNKVNEICE